MANRQRWCASHRWSVSVTTGSGISGARLNVTRHLEPSRDAVTRFVMLRGDADGRMFATSEEAFAYAHDRGYGERFETPWCTTCRVRHTTQYGTGPVRRSAYCPVRQATTFRQ